MSKLPDITVNPEEIQSLSQAKQVIGDLLNVIEKLMKQVQQLSNENQQLRIEIGKLKKQSNPPSFPASAQSSLNYSSSKQTKEKTTWHKNRKKPLLTIDRQEPLPEVTVCNNCGSTLFRIIGTWNKILQGLIIKRDTVRYNGRDKQCLNCGIVYKSIIPETIKGKEFSKELAGWTSVFKYDYHMSDRLILRFFHGLDIVISKGQITNILLENSDKLKESYSHLRIWGLKTSSYVHSDATGFFRALTGSGKRVREHLHFVGHRFLSLFMITRDYNGMTLTTKVFTKKALQRIIYISDDASANGRYLLIVLKQLCWIHEIRHYLKLDPKVRIHKQKLAEVIDQLWEWYAQAKDYGRDPTETKKKELEETFDKIMNQKTGYKELDQRLRLTRRKEERLLLFLDHPGIPIENNLAERDLREVVIMRKLSGGTKSNAGDRSFERHMSVIQTARKQGLNVFATLTGLITGKLSPFILTRRTLPALSA